MFSLKRFFIGKPLSTSQLAHERLTKRKALAVFSSDALSSVAYATEEILLVLVLAGAVALSYSLPIALGILTLLLILVLSYRQTILAYPSGGGAYIVAKDNLGVYPGLVAGSALLIDYTLTVAVSIAAGVAALTSAFPALMDHKVLIAVVFIWILTILNLRGITESATIFAFPTYIFIFSIIILVGSGIFELVTHGRPPVPELPEPALTGGVTLFLLLRAFSSGCAALTGVEAISNGVPAFKKPESRNAVITLMIMGGIIVILFGGITLLANLYHITPKHDETVVSQIAAEVFGRNFFYYLVQFSTAMILFLAANTSFAGFPMLASLLGQDGYVSRLLAARGDRLVYSNGIIVLATVASLLVIIFQGNVHALIPLYAVGVFLSFTLSQTGMVARWIRKKERGWLSHALINGFGAMVTGTVLVVIAITKFTHGAWMVIVLIPLIVLLFTKIHEHYLDVAKELAYHGEPVVKPNRHTIVIPLASLTRVVANTVEYAKTLSPDIVAVHISIDDEKAEKLRRKWGELEPDIKLVTIPSPYRAILTPLLEYINELEAQSRPGELITVLIPEFVTRKWWQYFLHNQSGLLLKTALLLRKDIVVASVPFHLSH